MKKNVFVTIFSIATFLLYPSIALANYSGSITWTFSYPNLTVNLASDVCGANGVGSPSPSYQLFFYDNTNNTPAGQLFNYSAFPYTQNIATLNIAQAGDSITAHLNCWNNGTAIDPTYTFIYAAPTPTPTPTPAVQIVANPSSSNMPVGTPFNVDVKVTDSGQAFNAAKATVNVSSNLSVTGVHNASSSSCNFQYTKNPTTSDPSFAGGIFGSSSTGCTVYTMTVTPNSTGAGTISFTNASIKAYTNNAEILTGTQNGSYTIGNGPTPTPTVALNQVTVTSPLVTYYFNNNYTLAGTKDTTITHVFINGSETGVTYPTGTTWQVSKTLSLGDNNFTLYGSDGTNQTATQTVDINRHTLGDINGDGIVDLTDASLFSVDWGKTSNLTYILSDMNGDGNADLTDLSILAKLEQ